MTKHTPSRTPTRPRATDALGLFHTPASGARSGGPKPARRVSFGRALVLRSPAAVLNRAAPASLTPAKGGSPPVRRGGVGSKVRKARGIGDANGKKRVLGGALGLAVPATPLVFDTETSVMLHTTPWEARGAGCVEGARAVGHNAASHARARPAPWSPPTHPPHHHPSYPTAPHPPPPARPHQVAPPPHPSRPPAVLLRVAVAAGSCARRRCRHAQAHPPPWQPDRMAFGGGSGCH